MSTSRLPSQDLPGTASSPADITRFVVDMAVNAPSVLNTQPWWFYGIGQEIGLHADDERKLPVADPDGREMLISCGAALFTARVALRYLGIVPAVRMLPEPGLDQLVAKIGWSELVPPVGYERELFAQIPLRRTHQGGFDDQPLPINVVAALRSEAAREDATLQIFADQAQQAALAAVVQAGEYALRHDAARAKEQASWAPAPNSARRDGVPASAYPARPEKVEPRFPARDYARGRGWGLPTAGYSQQLRSAGLIAILTTATDRHRDWISAGQALQRTLLYASSCGLSAAMHTQPLEEPSLREFTRTQFCDGAYPQLILRFGAARQAEVSVRRPADDVLI